MFRDPKYCFSACQKKKILSKKKLIFFTILNLIITFITCSGKLLRSSKYEEEISDGHLGINEKELNSMNKHIPGNFQLLWRTNRKTVFRGGGHHYKQALLGPLNQTSL